MARKNKAMIAHTEPTKVTNLTPKPVRPVAGPSTKMFDDLDSFEQFLKDESWDDEYDFLHAKCAYIPPFVLSEIHNDMEKIKPTMNSRSKKFVRNLHHHLERHLLSEINRMSGVDYKFEKSHETKPDGKVVWHYRDYSDHGFGEKEGERKWKVEVDVECNPDSPYVSLEMKSIPL
ncbi:unnamed protein product [Kuraishia capsulata CBS 1993]|uniref:Respiratory growth induced protein 1 n=1 Tax=Kuraishia capsulata CBS 1993 TaxID=1382522 RepID=W6MLU2_9ASCO|nr:uncharacterized protein KUCA_T00003085001 [Kuraishia capsulata CBS 1993]CDK27108.1 unnamed protein product [Kuraishia capsulata CBS 1993]